MDFENFAKKYELDVTKLEKEVKAIAKRDGCSPSAALNEWKRENFDQLAILKKGKKITALYLFTEAVPEFKNKDGSINDPFYRIFFLVLPDGEDSPPAIVFYKMQYEKIGELFKEEPKAFTAFDFERAYITKGKRLSYFRTTVDDNGLPLLAQRDSIDLDNKQLHEMFIHCSKEIELWYDPLQEKDVDWRNNVFCYLQVTSVGEPFNWTSKKGENAGTEYTCRTYYLADNIDETSLLRVVFKDWQSDLPELNRYDNIFFYGGYAKQNLEFENQLEIGWNDWNAMYIARCPTP